MLGEILAVSSACAFAVANVSIAKASGERRGDNGALLSILMTCVLSGGLWLAFGPSLSDIAALDTIFWGLLLFAIAGLLSMVWGRSFMFKSIEMAGATNGSLFRRLIPIFAAFFAFIILGETIDLQGGVGMAIITLGILLILFERRTNVLGPEDAIEDQWGGAGAVKIIDKTFSEGHSLRVGGLYGVGSSISYGASYVGRKLGMNAIPDPALGAFVGAAIGVIWYALRATVNTKYRRSITGLLRDTGRWQLVAAISISFGQTLAFFALKYTEVAIVAVIGSFEVVASSLLATFVFRTEIFPSATKIAAFVVVIFGVALISIS